MKAKDRDGRAMKHDDKPDLRVLLELVPTEWRESKGGDVWVKGYRVFDFSRDDRVGTVLADLTQVRVALVYGRLPYFDSLAVKEEVTERGIFREPPERDDWRETPEGKYLLFLAQAKVPRAPQEIDAAVGLVAAITGHNLLFGPRVFDMILRMPGARKAYLVKPLNDFVVPDFSEPSLDLVRRLDESIRELRASDQNRVRISLRWIESASFEPNEIDAFVKYWVALETIGMPDTTNIRPLIELVCSAYNLPVQTVKDRFAIGRLFGLRGRILHDGLLVSIAPRLLQYVVALYRDALLGFVGLPPTGDALRMVMGERGDALDEYIPRL